MELHESVNLMNSERVCSLLILTVGYAVDTLSSSSLWKQHHFSASVSWIQAGPPNPLAFVTVGAQKVEVFDRLPKK